LISPTENSSTRPWATEARQAFRQGGSRVSRFFYHDDNPDRGSTNDQRPAVDRGSAAQAQAFAREQQTIANNSRGGEWKNPRKHATMILAAVAWAALAAAQASAGGLVGQASVIDGDTLEIQGTHIRLDGIDAPESGCATASTARHTGAAKGQRWLWPAVTCTPTGNARSRPAIAGTDMGAWLVTQGHALDWPRYSRGRYSIFGEPAGRSGGPAGHPRGLVRQPVGLSPMHEGPLRPGCDVLG